MRLVLMKMVFHHQRHPLIQNQQVISKYRALSSDDFLLISVITCSSVQKSAMLGIMTQSGSENDRPPVDPTISFTKDFTANDVTQSVPQTPAQSGMGNPGGNNQGMADGPGVPNMPPPGYGPPPGYQSGYATPQYPGGPIPGYGYPAPVYGVDPSAPYGRHPMTGEPLSDKSKLVAGLLQIFLPFGAGRFYLGDNSTAIAQLAVTFFTCGIGSIWSVVDGIMIFTDKVRDRNNLPLRD
ncbi:MAG: TM2 domain-containing protein [Mycobacteriaceae bacterium]